MSKKLYVGNLSFKTSEEQVHELFASKGQVTSAKLIMDKFSGRSKGFAFVEMSNDNEAQEAINAFHDYEVDGRKLVVNEARPMEPRTGGFKGGGGFNKGGGGFKGGKGRGGSRGGGGGGGGDFRGKRSW